MDGNYLVRAAIIADCDQILTLLSKHYIGALGSKELKNGYISAKFSKTQLVKMITNPGVAVALNSHGQLIAVACTSTLDFNQNKSELNRAIYNLLKTIKYEGQKLPLKSTAFYGPVCVDFQYGGRGLSVEIFKAARSILRNQGFKYGLLFVDYENSRSMHVHFHKLSIQPLENFYVNEKSYALGLFPLNSS